MKILHTSDWHLGQHFYGKSRANEHQAFINWLLTLVENEAIDAVVIAGDIFDTGTPPSYARELYFNFVGRMQTLKCQLIVVAGNHDSVAMLSESKSVLGYLNTHVIAAAGDDVEQQIIEVKSKSNEQTLTVCAIPFIRPRDVITSEAGQSAAQKQQALQQGIAAHYQTLFEQAKSHGNPVLMTGHLTTVGALTTESVRDIYIGTLEAFPASGFPPADYIALGHIHKPQLVAKQENIRYSGSPIPLSFDEAATQKQVLIAHFDSEKLTQVQEVAVPQFQAIAMIKTSVDQLEQNLTAISEAHQEKSLWLDIEITATGYLQDLSSRVKQLIEDKPIEVLMLRRAKESRQKIAATTRTETLAELSVQEVFSERLAQEDWLEEQGQQRKQRLETLFSEFASTSQESAPENGKASQGENS